MPLSQPEVVSSSEPQDQSRSTHVQSVMRAAAILRALASVPVEGTRLRDLSEVVGLDRGTTHRLLSTLAEVDLVEQDKSSKCYRLGMGLFALASAAANRYDIQEVASASLGRLAASTGDTILFCLRAGDEAICVDLESGDYPIKTLPVDIGGRFPLGFGAAGIALLAQLPDSEINQILEKNRLRLSRFDASWEQAVSSSIVALRDNGYTYSEQNGVPGVASIALPILDRRGRPVAVISIAAIVGRLEQERRNDLVLQLRAEVEVISQVLMRRPDSRRQRQRWAAGFQ